MKVEMEVTFLKEEVLAMCLAKCGHIETAVEGKFKARYGYYGTGEVVCTFSPKEEEEELLSLPLPLPPIQTEVPETVEVAG